MRERSFMYAFENERFMNSDYVYVKGPETQIVIKDLPVFEKRPFDHNSAIHFRHTLSRPDFIRFNSGANDKRFDLPEDFDKSNYLTKVKRPKLICSFSDHTGREADHLIMRGGDKYFDLGGKTNNVYLSE